MRCAVILVTGFGAVAADTSQFGFAGPEIFPIENGVNQLRAADLDGDGLTDLVVANNARSKINLLYNQTGKTNASTQTRAGARRELNELPPDARFRVESIASEKRIAALLIADLNSDERPDLVYYGEPRELILLINEGTNHWAAPKRWQLDDVQLTANAVATGDLNGDSKTDLVLLAETHMYALLQSADGTLNEPQKIPFSGVSRSVQIVDLNADSRQDLLLVNWEDRHPFRFRLQVGQGELGPERYFAFPPIRSYWADAMDEKGRTHVITIAQNSGRAQISEFVRKEAPNLAGHLKQGQLQVLPLQRTERARRGARWADLDSNGLEDLVVAEPESGQLSFFAQNASGSFSSPKSFPSLAGVADMTVEDWDGDGRPEVFLLSPDERQVGVTRLDERQRFTFPSLVSLNGRPLVLAAGKLKPAEAPVLAVIVDVDGRRSLQIHRPGGIVSSQTLDEKFKSTPSSVSLHDADQDGRQDLVILTPYEKVKILRQRAEKGFDELDVPAPGGTMEQPWLSRADVDQDGKPELLLTQRNFVRAVDLRQEKGNSTNRGNWTFHVKQQINGASPTSRLTAAGALPSGRGPGSLFLLDGERKALSVCQQDTNGTWQIVRNVPLPVSDFDALQPVGLGGTNSNAIGLLGLNMAAVQPFSGEVWELSELDSYETPVRNGHLADVVTGDLDNDQRKDLVFLETARNYIDLVAFEKDRTLAPANRWPVFEERTFRPRRGDLPEPREALVFDFTGDGKNDLAILVHDRILLYPQE